MKPQHGPLGASLDQRGRDLLLRMQADSGFRKASREAQRLSLESGMYAPDIDVLLRFSGCGWLLVARCPNEFTAAHVQGIREERLIEKPGTVKEKTNPYGLLGHLVSDYDLMCLYRIGDGGERRRLDTDWDGQRPLDRSNPAEQIIADLNLMLEFKIQHGFNDCWTHNTAFGKKPRNPDIGSHFIAFECGHGEVIPSLPGLHIFYKARNMEWLYETGHC